MFSSERTIELITSDAVDIADKSANSNHSKAKAYEATQSLPDTFIPGPNENDVICGHGRSCFNHKGNRSFRDIVDCFVPEYINTSNKLAKSLIITTIVDRIRGAGGEFVRRDYGSYKYYKVGDFIAREKTSQAFRDAISRQLKSLSNSKTCNKIASMWNQCKSWNDEYQKTSNDPSLEPLNRSLIGSMVPSENTSIVAPSFLNHIIRSPFTMIHRQSSSLAYNEKDDFDKMIDDAIRPLQDEAQKLIFGMKTKLPSLSETKLEDFMINEIDRDLSLLRYDNKIDLGPILNSNSQADPLSLSQVKPLFAANTETLNFTATATIDAKQEAINKIDFSNIFDE